jgi:NAD(P)-dependent dehydrogenase (short-subunit alcohol dehydrogenase family)
MAGQNGLFGLQGKTAIVTGASYGLGVAMAETLSGAGANVVLTARSADKLKEVAGRIEAAGGAAMTIACDVGDPESVQAMVAAAWDRFGRVDILVNNAGQATEAGVMPENVPNELFEQTVRVNLMGTFYCCRDVGARQLADGKGGSIINISSVLGLNGQQNTPIAYQASKAAVVNLTRNLACSWGDRGIRVNCIAPGWFPSEMTAGWFAVPQFFARFRGQSPMGRVGELSELAGPLLFLASDASSFVTGAVLPVDGGMSAASGQAPYTEELFTVQAEVVPVYGERIMPAKG